MTVGDYTTLGVRNPEFLLPRLSEGAEARIIGMVSTLKTRMWAIRNATPALGRYIQEIIPRDPNAAEFRQGNTLGIDNRHWFRAKFHERYRLFYRFSSKEKVIVYAWVNDEGTLRKAGSKTDPYAVFRAMLDSGNPPSTMAELLAISAKVETGRSSQQAASRLGKKRNR